MTTIPSRNSQRPVEHAYSEISEMWFIFKSSAFFFFFSEKNHLNWGRWKETHFNYNIVLSRKKINEGE